MAAFAVKSKFGLVSFQGFPLFGKRLYGVPTGGALDQASWQFANAIVGNDPPLLAVEICMGSLTLEFEQCALLGIVGASEKILVNGNLLLTPCRVFLARGDCLEVLAPTLGIATYISVYGGFFCHSEAHSAVYSTLEGANTSLHHAPPELSFARYSLPQISNDPIRVVCQRQELLGEYVVRHDSSRAGIRLQGTPLTPEPYRKSEPTQVGAMQIANDGLPIIVGRDGPVTGGYGIAGIIAEADLDRTFQSVPGTKLPFKSVSLEEAKLALRLQNESHRQTVSRILMQLRG